MRKLIISTIAVASLLAGVATASAGYGFNGVYYPTCGTVWNGFAWVYVCG
jgi:hypothetical protein